MGGLTWAQPWWLLALPVIGALAWAARGQGGALGGWGRAVDPALMAALVALGRVVPGRARGAWVAALVAGVTVLALAGPSTRARDAETYRNLDGLVLVLDLSRSTTSGASLAALTTAARVVLGLAGSRPVALVLFAGDAYLASPFTNDLDVLAQTIGYLDGATVPDPGSRPELALTLAAETLAAAGVLAGDVVLVGDGGGMGQGARAAARRIAEAGARLSTVHLQPVPGAPPGDRAAMRDLARTGGGVAVDGGEMTALGRQIGGDFAGRLRASGYDALLWHDHGRWLLVLALGPALMLFRRAA